MSSVLFGCLSWLLAASPLTESPATDLHYTTQLSQLDRRGNASPVHEYQTHVFVTPGTKEQPQSTFHFVDDAGDALAWIGRFGHTQGKGAASAVLNVHKHDGLPYPLTLRVPFLSGHPPLAADVTWEEGQVEYQVTGTRRSGEWDCWVVESTDGLGKRGTFLVDQQDGVVVAISQRVFMGQGDRFELATKLQSATAVPDAAREKIASVGGSLRNLQKELGYDGRASEFELTAPQLDTVAGQTESLAAEAKGTPYETLIAVIHRDVKAQQQRASAVADLSEKFVGKAAPPIRVKTLAGTDFDASSFQGKVVVLHFWEYRDSPLAEPYGQIGYLDFLASRRAADGVRVLGVAVDSRLTSPDTSAAAVRSIRKLKEFMNVGYEITTDTGELIKGLGDPRQFSAPLPLWVVIGKDGKVVHYRTGLYKVDVNRGLEELDAAVVKALKAR